MFKLTMRNLTNLLNVSELDSSLYLLNSAGKMPTSRKVGRRSQRRFKSPKRINPCRSSISMSIERRPRSVSPSRNRWRDDIRKMKSWREQKKGSSKEKKGRKADGMSDRGKSNIQLKRKLKASQACSAINKIVESTEMKPVEISEIRSMITTQIPEEQKNLKIVPDELNHVIYHNEKLDQFYYICLYFKASVTCSREDLTRKISLLELKMEIYITRLQDLERERCLLLQQREDLKVN